ncbi:23S rRNA (uracil(1939)-C(5))-methyltransferase RlmD [Polycladomyces sp. WAk]|uniref:23S rRNA (Uracil(1939)-C(5))-methyltransferase RlmD n=1 Tax=Polycladomyces zharkentensis TaxID=2807616 RepID=A0ABS2WHF9_9BACL|nr:23S rRNA (uracil(1939)-C(5))-methyltransferase RlmD [Polycladomyces sp. WAk]MBN2908849.1 23S rRNA (uracil(1939)-C(5))-methyltransferase RlmD [Polycladomyces sp. WAk]
MTKNETMIRLKKGETIRLPIRRLGINGEGVGFYQKQVVFVDGAIPGEVVVARVESVERRFAKARLLRIRKRSPHRIQPPCPVYADCGGCQLQHIDYPMQLKLKKELVEEAFVRYTSLRELPIEETVGMDEPWQYRNKAQLPVQLRGKKVVMGMYSARSHRLVDMRECGVQHPETNRILETARKTVEEIGIPIYDEKKHTGVLRHLVARFGFRTGEAQLVLVCRTDELPQERELVERLVRRLPQVKSIVLNINPKRTSLVFGEKNRILWGKETVDERLNENVYALSATAFFQLNPIQTVKLYDLVKEAAELTGKETVIDAYCGVGTIGLWLADRAARIIGMDTIPSAVEDARCNAKRNGIDHAEYHIGQAEDLLPRWVKAGLRPDVVVVDPPRTGLGQPLIDMLREVRVPRLVYVSCNPSTLAKDCAQLLQGGYELERLVPVDMFPQTAHVETVCTLSATKER